MCGRYYVDDETAGEIEKLVRQVDEKLKKGKWTGGGAVDVHPGEYAAVLTADKKEMKAVAKRWGFPGFGGGKVIFNARAESVLEKRMFRESVLRRRLIVPAAGFYEWNSHKEKVTFLSGERPVLYMAGFYDQFAGEDRFVILTTAANVAVKGTHDRMPLLLERTELEQWLWEDGALEWFLRKEPHLLQKRQMYQQQRLSL